MLTVQAPKHRQAYDDAEIALIYLLERTDAAREILARLLGRSEGAVDLVWRWADKADFPPEAANRIARQVAWVEERLGTENRGRITVS